MKVARHVTLSTKMTVYARYGIPWLRRLGYRVDHLIPLELNGTNNLRNLWPQPKDEAHLKDVDENHLTTAVAHGSLTLSQAQAEMLRLWTLRQP